MKKEGKFDKFNPFRQFLPFVFTHKGKDFLRVRVGRDEPSSTRSQTSRRVAQARLQSPLDGWIRKAVAFPPDRLRAIRGETIKKKVKFED